MYVGLESVATAGTFLANPTISAGDVLVSKDGGATANITTLPTATPASGNMVKVTLSSTEMTADNVTVTFHQVSGGTWKDLMINLATVANQNDDMLTQGTGTNQISLSSGLVTLAAVTHTGAVIPTVTTTTTATNLTTNNDKTGYALSSAGVQAVWDALTSALSTVNSIGKLLVTNIDAAISSRLATSGYTAPTTPPTVAAIRTEMDTNSTKLANLDATVSSRSTFAGGAVASVTGNVGGSVASVTAGVSLANGAITAAKFGTDAIDANALAASAVTEIQSGLATPTNITAGTITTVGTVNAIANNAIDAATVTTALKQAIADAILSRAVSNVEATASAGTLAEVILAMFESKATGNTWLIYRTDHSTAFSTRTLTTDSSALPITEVN